MLTPEELLHCDGMTQDDWQKEFQYTGDFRLQIMKAIELADVINLKKIATVYPNLVAAYLKWQKGGK